MSAETQCASSHGAVQAASDFPIGYVLSCNHIADGECLSMHLRKGSFGYLSVRSRVGSRWSRIILFISVSLLLFFSSTSRYRILPTSQLSSSLSSCPIFPPSPSLTSTSRGRFRWGDIPTRYPVQNFEQLPRRAAQHPPKVQYDFSKEHRTPSQKIINARRRAAVRTTFLRSWDAYKRHAWAQDELLPISNGSKSTLGGWGLTLVDSLSILWLMDLKDEFNTAVAAVSEIEFASKDITINVAEVTTHHLGGLLSAYDLTGCQDIRLLHKALELGDMLYAAFDTLNRMPIVHWNPLKAANGEVQEALKDGTLTDLTSIVLEFTRLSQLTRDMQYYDAAARITTLLASQQNSTAIPGLWPSSIDMRTANMTEGRIFTPHSVYSLLPRMLQLLHSTPTATRYTTMLSLSLNTLLPTLLFRPITPSNTDILTPTTAFLSPSNSIVRDHTMQHTSCTLGASLALASALLPNSSLLPYARRITESCIWAHTAAPHGLMPSSFTMLACASSHPENDRDNCTFDPSVWPAQQYPGFEIVMDGRYDLRPEAVWSVLVMYRTTGEERYREVGWEMWRRIEEGMAGEGGSAVVRDVMAQGDGELGKVDEMPSIWMAATLKYFYLLFSDPDVGSLDEWVFSEGGHMFRLR